MADLEDRIVDFYAGFRRDGAVRGAVFDGGFALRQELAGPDLYGAADAVYALHTIGRLEDVTTPDSRQRWAERLLAFQDAEGWFSGANTRGHRAEHASAYAMGALILLRRPGDPSYLDAMQPIAPLRNIATSREAAEACIRRLGWRGWRGIPAKDVGWQHVWRSSHVGGGIMAMLAMADHLLPQWWAGEPSGARAVGWMLDWLDREVDPRTGLWRRALWNRVVRRPTMIDLGGAAHFHWIYAAQARPIRFPAALVRSVLNLQKAEGLYGTRPYCLDLDANFCLLRAFEQLPPEETAALKPAVDAALARNFTAILQVLDDRPLHDSYDDTHALPGALAALTESARSPDLPDRARVRHWSHVLDSVCWL